MLLTTSQSNRFWREWGAIVKANNWPKPEAEVRRKQLLREAGFESLTRVDPGKGFDAVLMGLMALARPDDLEAQMKLAQMERTRLFYAIRKLAHEISPAEVKSAAFDSPYVAAIMRDIYGHDDPDRLSLQQLEQFRNTLNNRLHSKRQSNELSQEAEPF